MANPVIVKLLAVGAVTFGLSLALMRIGGIVDDRMQHQREAQRSVEASLAGRQALLGPVLHRSCVEEWDTVSIGREVVKTTNRREFRLVLPPSTLRIEGDVAIDQRQRGLFSVNTFATKATLHAHWDTVAPLAAQREHAGSRLSCGAPVLMVALSDARGVRDAKLRVDGAALPVKPGTEHAVYPRGMHAVLPADKVDGHAQATPATQALDAELTLELVGTAELAIAPAAGSVQATLRSAWPHPSFGGRFLPAERKVSESGFEAQWRVSALASSAAREVVAGAALCEPSSMFAPGYHAGEDAPHAARSGANKGCIETFGVAFIDPVNPYSLSDRSIKYGLLFILLTFGLVGATEVLRGTLRVHPIQYALVGAALTLFFLLLLSLSEHLPFAAAYTSASAACVLLLGYYASHALGGWRVGAGFAAGITLLYAVLYALLQLERTALVMGSLLLFAVLATLMAVTRKVDWYALLQRAPRDAAEGPNDARLRTAGLGASQAKAGA